MTKIRCLLLIAVLLTGCNASSPGPQPTPASANSGNGSSGSNSGNGGASGGGGGGGGSSPPAVQLPASGHIDVWVNDDIQNGAVAVPAGVVQAFSTYAENQLQGKLGKAATDCLAAYSGGNINLNSNPNPYAGGNFPSWCSVIQHYQANAMPAGAEVGSTCTGSNNPPFFQFYTNIQNGSLNENLVFHSGSSDVAHRINKNFNNPNLGCNASSNNFINNYGQAAMRAAAQVCQDTQLSDPAINASTYGCDLGFDLTTIVMYDNNHVTLNRTCGQCGWTSTLEGVSDDNYSGGVGNSSFCASNLCQAADLGPTIDANHKALYNADFHRDGVTPWKIFINQYQDGQISNNVSPRCTDLIGGFNNGSANVVLIQNEDAFEDTSNDETVAYNPWQWAFALNTASCALYNGVNSTIAYEVHQVDDYVQGCSGGPCSQSIIIANRLKYLSLLYLYFEGSRTPAGQQVVNNGGHPLSTNDHYVLSSMPEYSYYPTGPLESMCPYNVPTVASPGQDGSGGSASDTINDCGTVGLVLDALHAGGPQNSVVCGWSGVTVGSGNGTNTNKKVCMVARQFAHIWKYVATMAQALTRTGTWVDEGPGASIVNIPQSTGANSTPANTANTGQMVPCNTSVGNHAFASGGIGDFSQYSHMMTLASYASAPGGFMGVATNDPGSNASIAFPGACASNNSTACSDANFARANGPGDANLDGAAFVCYNGSNAGSATVIGPGSGVIVNR